MASSPCPDLNLIHYKMQTLAYEKGRLKRNVPFQTTFALCRQI
ncbi:hypothetical protein NEISICOT_00592 [Neisseria sicca ATCC 29256]|uniref:Uncharacterized protein n=1 Tax=Neisseria sicca ATCC 29256 TaxID=547045 RepID=C6M254_NEISI|nr:hypothetical protein NEISICOT_00592 [Neisseria sicca ATCC 29256]